MAAKIPENYKKLVEEFDKIPRVNGLKLQNLPPAEIPENPADFLYLFFTDWSNKYKTIAENDGHVVTGICRSRSLNETFDVVRNYYENYDLKKYFQNIYEMFVRLNIENEKKINNEKGSEKLPGLTYLFTCPDIQRVVASKGFSVKYSTNFAPPKPIFPYYFVHGGYFKIHHPLTHYLYDESVCEYLLGNKYKK